MSDATDLQAGNSEEGNTDSEFLGMTDEAFLSMGDAITNDTETTDEEEVAEDEGDEAEAEAGSEVTNEEENSIDDEDGEQASDSDLGGDDGDGDDDSDESDESDASDEDGTDDENAVDFADFHKQLTAPFKANGKMMQVESPEDAVRLMQMGANYNRKMAGMKPHMKILKTLEQNELLDEGKLNFLIDVQKKNPQAIARLLKDSGVDPMELDLDTEKNYEVPNYTVDDNAVELDTVLDELRESDTYPQTLDVVSNKWDRESQQIVREAPQLISVINDHMASGIYKVISTEVERQKMFGQLEGMSDLEAYRTVGDSLNAEGKLTHLVPGNPDKPVDKATASVKKKLAAAKEATASKRRAKRQAASPSKPTNEKSTPEFNPLGMSDEEYLKLGDPNFL